MFIPVDTHGNWVTISIMNCNTICAFQSAGEVVETAAMFQPSLKVKAKLIELDAWEQTLTDAMDSGVKFAVEFLVRGAPKLTLIGDMLDEVRQRMVRQSQLAVRRPSQVCKAR